MINRRAFLSLLASGLVGAAVDVDRALWEPGKKTIFLPPAPRVDLQGISVRFVKEFDAHIYQLPTRLDVLYGFRMMRPDMGVRVCSS